MIPKITNRHTLRTIGMATLALGAGWHALLPRVVPIGADLLDGVWGLLIGISIATMLLSLRRTDREC